MKKGFIMGNTRNNGHNSKLQVDIQPNIRRNRITNPATDSIIMLFAISFGVAPILRKFVNNISGSDMLNITFDNISFDSGVSTLIFAAIAPISTTTVRIKI